MRQLENTVEIQKIAMYILEKFDVFCKEHKIEYFLAYGTLIGAIRHKGFIPWDDDIDVWVKREEYIRFIKMFPVWGERYGLYINSMQTTDGYNRIFAKICIENSEVKTLDMENTYHEGCFIDVFVIDGSPNNTLLRKIRIRHLQCLRNILTLSAYNAHKLPNASRQAKFRGFISSFFKGVNQKKIIEKYEKVASKSMCKESDYLLMPVRKSHGKAVVIPSGWFEEPVNWNFEHIVSYVPKGFDPLLKLIYGDYMKLPPEDQRIPGHAARFFVENDFEKYGIL